ncbi:hypothetical protein Sango_1155700 [Sesamum angolense]|uniref:Uncharacterized protein n=1 Tax=Sesamum angolense TaxID=2727404 RepID=A0AAE1WW38_9LAMI|nr:hypothetical protein Sango_1155700 [Sesamum angolense]
MVMNKAVLQAIPFYAMSCFKIPEARLKEIKGMIVAFFWWHQDEDSLAGNGEGPSLCLELEVLPVSSLPTKLNLLRRGVEVDGLCALCGDGEEGIEHVLSIARLPGWNTCTFEGGTGDTQALVNQGQPSYVDKYITKTYFEKHDGLIDMEFDNFIANEIPLTLCKVLEDGNCVLPTLSNLHRSVIGEVIMTERLPSGVFADPFELQHLVQRGVFSDAAVFGDTNLELPSFRSNRSVVEIHMSIGSKMLSRHHDKLEINLEVPLHARYSPLGLGFSRVEFGQPDLFMCCRLEGNGFKRNCAYLPTNNISDYKASPLAWE